MNHRVRHFLHKQLMSQMLGHLCVADEFEGALLVFVSGFYGFSLAAAVNNTGLPLFAGLPATHETLV